MRSVGSQRSAVTLGLLLVLTVIPSAGLGQEPFYKLRDHETTYNGPGREDPVPNGLNEVRIGYFGPSDPKHPEGGDLWLAAQLALEEANGEGGYRGVPFRLVSCWSQNQWGTGISQLAKMVYAEKVWAIVGSIDGASTHLAEQVVAKARLPLVSPVSSDKTINLANVPWMFSLTPGDHLIAPVVARAIVDRTGAPFVLVSSTDHDSRLFTDELRAELTKLRVTPSYHWVLNPGQNVEPIVERVKSSSIQTVVIAAGAQDASRLVTSLRAGRFRGDVVGGPSLGRRAFIEEVQEKGNGVLFPVFSSADDVFVKRFGRETDYAARQVYDAVRLLVDAIRKAGLNRMRIRDALVDLAPWKGVGGPVAWDPLGQNVRPVRLGTYRDGTVVPIAEDDCTSSELPSAEHGKVQPPCGPQSQSSSRCYQSIDDCLLSSLDRGLKNRTQAIVRHHLELS
jgi:ABC-type branched-subunit amino acid transport system substrate-binding protein